MRHKNVPVPNSITNSPKLCSPHTLLCIACISGSTTAGLGRCPDFWGLEHHQREGACLYFGLWSLELWGSMLMSTVVNWNSCVQFHCISSHLPLRISVAFSRMRRGRTKEASPSPRNLTIKFPDWPSLASQTSTCRSLGGHPPSFSSVQHHMRQVVRQSNAPKRKLLHTPLCTSSCLCRSTPSLTTLQSKLCGGGSASLALTGAGGCGLCVPLFST